MHNGQHGNCTHCRTVRERRSRSHPPASPTRRTGSDVEGGGVPFVEIEPDGDINIGGVEVFDADTGWAGSDDSSGGDW
ncbi:hypothetical protein [Nonomuraea basaltis]|uniref:hypothetical protein n=1 Tax=Nonomuraea basaltis TaxID=2495887 RepID=UPI00110C5C4C|nr:hypothetical protein [Nonomuraea basaltis]TMR89494.1 hypothetical protein EJK15_60460 [Nonomuraea basaltis]